MPKRKKGQFPSLELMQARALLSHPHSMSMPGLSLTSSDKGIVVKPTDAKIAEMLNDRHPHLWATWDPNEASMPITYDHCLAYNFEDYMKALEGKPQGTVRQQVFSQEIHNIICLTKEVLEMPDPEPSSLELIIPEPDIEDEDEVDDEDDEDGGSDSD